MDYRKKLVELGFVTHDILSYGDYDNSCAVERANCRELKNDPYYKDTCENITVSELEIGNLSRGEDGLSAWTPYSPDAETNMITVNFAYNGVQVWIKNDEYAEDILRGLDDYPCISDETMSEIETEMEDEAWSGWIESDIGRALSKLEDDEKTRDAWDALTDDGRHELYRTAMDKTNTCGHCESGGTWYVDIDRLLPAIIESLQVIS